MQCCGIRWLVGHLNMTDYDPTKLFFLPPLELWRHLGAEKTDPNAKRIKSVTGLHSRNGLTEQLADRTEQTTLQSIKKKRKKDWT